MNKQIIYKTRGHRADIGEFKIMRLVSNEYVDHVGHFVFLDFIAPAKLNKEKKVNPAAAHPHRGIATLTYLLNGEVDHYDSRGHRGTVGSGGVQWMKAANGIIHNEAVGADSASNEIMGSGFQFWINLPAANKKENPAYLAVQANELPLLSLPENAGTLKVVVGEFEGQSSPIPTYAVQNLWHIRLNPGAKFTWSAPADHELAAFLPRQNLTINSENCIAGELVGFDTQAGTLTFVNPSQGEAEFILFGGEKYTEPYVAHGPFVMNTMDEIRQAYSDYHAGKYGKMIYG